MAQQDTTSTMKDYTREAKRTIDNTTDSVLGAAEETRRQVQAVGDNVKSAFDRSLRDQPYMTLVLAAAVGFAIGAIWKS